MRRPSPRRHRFVPRFEALEDRRVPAGWAIGNSAGQLAGIAAESAPYTDADGNTYVYVSGYFQPGSFTLGGTTLNAAVTTSFVAKVDSGGHFVWARQFGGQGGQMAGVAVDAAGDAYATGRFGGTQAFGPFTLTSAGDGDGYVVKLDPAGNFLWARQMGGVYSDQGTAIAVDAAGDPSIAGFFNGTATFGPTTLTAPAGGSQANYGMFLSKLDAGGNFLWSDRLLGQYTGEAWSVAVDGAGNAYVGGNYNGGPTGAFLLQVGAGGNVGWLDNPASRPFAVTTYQDPVSGATAVYAAGDNLAVLKVDAATGATTWAETMSPNAGGQVRALATDAAGNLYVSGSCDGTNDLDPGPGTAYLPAPANGVFLLRLSPAGDFQSLRGLANAGATGWGLAVDGAGNIYTAGQFGGTGTFDTGTQTVTLSPGTTSNLFVCQTTQGLGTMYGRAFNDLNGDGVYEPGAGETLLPNATMYLDLNSNGAPDAGEPMVTSDATGAYRFNYLAPGTYTVRQAAPAGWTTAVPAGGSYTATVGAAAFADGLDFADHAPSQTFTYSNNAVVKWASKAGSTATSKITVADSYPIFDLSVTVNVSAGTPGSLSVSLVAPDGTVVGGPGIAPNGTTHLPMLDYKGVKGTWTLQVVNGKSGNSGQINSWSLSVLGPTVPQIASLAASPNPVKAGTNLTLTAGGVHDSNAGGSVTQVAFYRDANGDGILEPWADQLLIRLRHDDERHDVEPDRLDGGDADGDGHLFRGGEGQRRTVQLPPGGCGPADVSGDRGAELHGPRLLSHVITFPHSAWRRASSPPLAAPWRAAV